MIQNIRKTVVEVFLKRSSILPKRKFTNIKNPCCPREPVMNDLPVPAGCWRILHSKRNRVYDIILWSGIFTMCTTFAIGYRFDMIYFFYNPIKHLRFEL